MPFTGKATYTGGPSLPEIVEDVSDLVSINSPHETPLLDALGDSIRAAGSTVHEWLEDSLLPAFDQIDDPNLTTPASDTTITMSNAGRFRVGDQIRQEGLTEVMMVTAVNTATDVITVIRGYGGTSPQPLVDGTTVQILGNAALEGDDAGVARFTTRGRLTNYTQIFSATVEVSGSELAVRQHAVADELDYQKQQRIREMLRDLENSVINGRAPAVGPEGSATGRRTMRGILSYINTNRFMPSINGFPAGTTLTEDQLNYALRQIWKNSNAQVDTLLVGATQKRQINQFIGANRKFGPDDQTYRNLVSVYESDFGVCRVILSRHVPAGTLFLLDSTRLSVLPLAGRSFHYKPLATTGDRESGQLIGEYTLEMRNENAHGVISGLAA